MQRRKDFGIHCAPRSFAIYRTNVLLHLRSIAQLGGTLKVGEAHANVSRFCLGTEVMGR